MSTVGTAYVYIRALSPQLTRDISQAASKMADAAAPAAEKAGEKIGDKVAEGTRKGTAKVGDRLKPTFDDAGRVVGERMAQNLNKSFILNAYAKLSNGARSVANRIRTTDFEAKGKELGQKVGKGLTEGISDFKIPLPLMLGFLGIPAIGGALKILGSYVAGAVSLVGALGPAFAAAGGVGAAGILTLGGAVATVMIGLKTQTPVLDRFKAVTASIGKQFQVVGLTIQRALLPQLARALNFTTRAIPQLAGSLGGLGNAVGYVAQRLAVVLTTPEQLKRIAVIFAQSDIQVRGLGNTLTALITAFLVLGRAAAPFLTQFVNFLDRGASRLAVLAVAGEQTGRLAAFMQRGATVAAQLGRILGDLARGLFNVFSAAAPAGQTLLNNIEVLTSRFAAFTGSVQGKAQLKAFFDNALPVIREVNLLIGDILKLIVAPIASGNNAGVIAFIGTLRTNLLPALTEIGQSTSSLGPHLIALTTSFAGLLNTLAQSGALGTFVTSLTTMIDVTAQILSNPIAATVATWALQFLGAAKALDIFLKPFGGLKILSGPVSFVLGQLGGALGKLAGFLGPVLLNGLKGLAIGIRVVGAAILGNPIGLLVTALVALGVGLYIAYQRSETFRNIVNKVGQAIKTGFFAAINALVVAFHAVVGALQTAGSAIVTAWNAVISFFKGVGQFFVNLWGTIISAVKTGVAGVLAAFDFVRPLLNILTQPLQGIIQIFTGWFQIFKGLFTGNLNQVLDGVANIIGGVVRAFLGAPARIGAAIAPLLPAVGAFFVSVGSAIINAVISGWNATYAFVVSIPGRFIAGVNALIALATGWMTSVWNFIRNTAVAGFNATIAFVAAFPGRFIAVVNGLIAAASAWMRSVWSTVSSAASAGYNSVISFVTAFPGRFISAVNSLISAAGAWMNSVWHTVGAAVSTGIAGVVSFVSALPGRVISAVGNLGSALYSAGASLIEGLTRGIQDKLGQALNTARDLGNKIADTVRSALSINSPSRVFIKIGNSVGEGAVIGLKNSTAVSAKQAAIMARKITEAGTPAKIQINSAGQVTSTSTSNDPFFRGPGGGPAAGGSVVNNTYNVYNPVAEKTSISTTKANNRAASLGAFS